MKQERMQVVQVDEPANGREINIPVGVTLEVRLAESPTTGFRWNLILDGQPVLKPAEDEREPAFGSPRSGGWRRWRFQAEREGVGRIELQYERPWESEGGPAQVFSLRVRVE